MKKGQHGEPWFEYESSGKGGWTLFFNNPGRFKRVVACVNALDGMDPDGVAELVAVTERVATYKTAPASEPGFMNAGDWYSMQNEAIAALAKLEGK